MAEICWQVWGTPANCNGFRVLAALLHGTLVVGVGQTLRRWTSYIRQGCHHVGHWPTFLVKFIFISPMGAVAKYCCEYIRVSVCLSLCLSVSLCVCLSVWHVCLSVVCLSVCLQAYLRNHRHDLYQFFCACCLWPWLDPPVRWWNPKGKGQFWGFSSHWQSIVMRSLQKGSFDRE